MVSLQKPPLCLFPVSKSYFFKKNLEDLVRPDPYHFTSSFCMAPKPNSWLQAILYSLSHLDIRKLFLGINISLFIIWQQLYDKIRSVPILLLGYSGINILEVMKKMQASYSPPQWKLHLKENFTFYYFNVKHIQCFSYYIIELIYLDNKDLMFIHIKQTGHFAQHKLIIPYPWIYC